MCVRSLARALIDPWTDNHDVCLPVGDIRASVHQKQFARATGVIGTGGVGYALFRPILSDDAAVGSAPIVCTTAAYAGTQATAISATPGADLVETLTVGAVIPNAAYAVGTNPATGRSVFLAARGRYSGTVLNKGGSIVTWADFEDFEIVGMTPAAVRTRATARVAPMNESWHEARFILQNAVYNSFRPFSQPLNAVAPSAVACPMVMIFVGTPGESFEVELVHFSEARYSNVAPLYVDSPTDTTGAQALVSVAQSATPGGTRGSQASFRQHIVGFLEGSADMVQAGTRLGGSVLNAYATFSGRSLGGLGQSRRMAIDVD